MRSPRIASLVLASLLVATACHAGSLEGVLWMSRESQAASARRPEPAQRTRMQRGVSEAVVWVEDVPEKVELKLASPRRGWFWSKPKPEPLQSIRQVGQRFQPRVLAVPAGSQVEFCNADRVYHSTFSVSAAKRFDLGKYPPGKRDTVEFARRGVVNLHSDLFPDMSGFVVVTPNHAYARPDSLGRFTLPKLPPGRYTLHAWHPVRGELKRDFEVPKRGEILLELRF